MINSHWYGLLTVLSIELLLDSTPDLVGVVALTEIARRIDALQRSAGDPVMETLVPLRLFGVLIIFGVLERRILLSLCSEPTEETRLMLILSAVAIFGTDSLLPASVSDGAMLDTEFLWSTSRSAPPCVGSLLVDNGLFEDASAGDMSCAV